LKTLERIARHTGCVISAPKNIALRALDIPLKPRWVVFMPTDRCNSRCLHCNIWQQKTTDNPLRPDEIEKIFGDGLFEKVGCVMLTGGEATTRSDINEVILRIHKVLPETLIQLSTNALLPQRAFDAAKMAMEHNINFAVGVSLDGIGEAHDKMRGVKGNFEKVDWLLRKLVELREKHGSKLNVAAGIVLSDFTLDSLEAVRQYARGLCIGLVEQWYNESSFYSNVGDKKFHQELYDAVKSQQPTPLQESWLGSLKGKSIRFPCFALYRFCVLKCNGDIVPCLNKWDSTAGNIRESSPSQIWYGQRAKEVRAGIRNCKGCLNGWQVGWSFESSYHQILSFYLRHPKLLVAKVCSGS